MYNQTDKQIKSILDVWKIIELSTPSKNETLNSYFAYAQKHVTDQKEFYKEINKKEALFLLQDAPFEKFNKETLKKELPDYDICVHWHLYLGYLNWTEAEIAIEEKINELFEVKPKILYSYKNRKNPVLTPIVALTLDEDMNLIDNSMVISTGAYVLGKVVREGFSEDDFDDLIEFEDNSAALIVNALKDSFDRTGQQKKFTLERVNYITDFIVNELQIDEKFLLSNPEICVRKITYKKLKKHEKAIKAANSSLKESTKQELDWAPAPALEMFNSFFLKPLDLVRNNIDKFTVNSSIAKYLGANDKPNVKDVLREPLFLKELLEPSKMQHSRWPSSPKNCLAALQTAAINTMLQKTGYTERLFAVNGPPGTGKTTLLFDVIANIYVKRALNLAALKTPDEGFNNEQLCFKVAGNEYKVKALVPSLSNHEIVIASSNNNAVENISKELPLYAKIDKIYHEELQFFNWLVNDTDKNINWGIFTAVLGRSANRQSFMEKFWKPEFPKDGKAYQDKTMFQYLNLLKGKPEAITLKDLMPEYCNSYVDTKKQWQKECQYFHELYQDISEINNTIEKIITLNKQKADLLKDYPNKDLLAILDEYIEQIKNLESTLKYIDSKIQEFNYETDSLSLGFLKPIHSFFKTKKYNDFIQNNLRLIRLKNEQLELKEKTKLDIQNLQNKSKQLNFDIVELEQIEKSLSICIKLLRAKNFETVDFNEDDFWQNYSNDCDGFHKITPYFNEEVEKLRSKLFIQAIKLHEIFINANAHNFLDSLILFSEILNGKFSNIEPDMWKAVWQNFFMIVPVVSTTFHSFDNMFKHFCHNDIAWLIIDEAGQTPPQYAASAIDKSKNVIVVGDPMQTAPISV
ncbi:MAG TPA: AAA family ATPase [Rickettsia endosymbiont of Pyrocoelia pectoralis]|nr:AAA family ATPase [Rickettsia endosymbiont of Pyrocoelia pectoralis]